MLATKNKKGSLITPQSEGKKTRAQKSLWLIKRSLREHSAKDKFVFFLSPRQQASFSQGMSGWVSAAISKTLRLGSATLKLLPVCVSAGHLIHFLSARPDRGGINTCKQRSGCLCSSVLPGRTIMVMKPSARLSCLTLSGATQRPG